MREILGAGAILRTKMEGDLNMAREHSAVCYVLCRIGFRVEKRGKPFKKVRPGSVLNGCVMSSRFLRAV